MIDHKQRITNFLDDELEYITDGIEIVTVLITIFQNDGPTVTYECQSNFNEIEDTFVSELAELTQYIGDNDERFEFSILTIEMDGWGEGKAYHSARDEDMDTIDKWIDDNHNGLKLRLVTLIDAVSVRDYREAGEDDE